MTDTTRRARCLATADRFHAAADRLALSGSPAAPRVRQRAREWEALAEGTDRQVPATKPETLACIAFPLDLFAAAAVDTPAL